MIILSLKNSFFLEKREFIPCSLVSGADLEGGVKGDPATILF